jgi:uncharacterized DUF497 family protein
VQFEWDESKAESNFAKHNVPFDKAILAFDDPSRRTVADTRKDYGEARWILVGLSEGRLLTVVWTRRDEKIRLISARGANQREKRDYEKQNG